MMDDAELLRDYAETRSETAFAGFVERRIGFVYATALRMLAGNAHTAQDVTQAVFILAANKSAALANHERLAGWLYTTTRNASRETLRETRRRDVREQEAARMSEIEQNVTDAAKLRPMLDEALAVLREAEREAVLLRYFEGMAFAGIGVKLKMSEEAARKRVTRAIEKMRAALAKRGVTSSAAALGALMTAEAAQAAPAGLAASVSTGAVTTATAASAAAVTGTSAILAFMSSAKITTAAAIALLVAAGGAYYGAQGERATSAALAQARHENATLQTQLREAEKQNAKAGAAVARREREAAGQVFLADHPEVKEKMAAWTNAIGARAIFRISREMNLSPEQSARLAEIVSSGGFGITASVSGYGDVTLHLGNPRPESKREQEMRDLLGEDGYEKFRELSALDDAGADFNIRNLSTALYFTDAPLTSQQARSLDAIARDLEQNHAGITDPQARWNAFMEQAKSILSPEQMSALVEVGDRNIWRGVSNKWINDYDEAHTVETKTPPPRRPPRKK